MRRLAGCLVVSVLACAAAWVGCRDDFDDPSPAFAVGSAIDSAVGGDAYGGGPAGSDAMVIPVDAALPIDVFVEGGSGSDAALPLDAFGEGGSGSDAALPIDAFVEGGSGSDAAL